MKNTKMWGGPAAGAAVFFVLGVALLVWPEIVLLIFPPLVGILLLLVGLQQVTHTVVFYQKVIEPGMKLVQGFVEAIVGVVFLLKQNISLMFFTILFGLYILVIAAVRFSTALQEKKSGNPWKSSFFESVFQLALGLLMLFGPFGQNMLWARLLGAHFVLSAGGALLWMRREAKRNKPDQADGQPNQPPQA